MNTAKYVCPPCVFKRSHTYVYSYQRACATRAWSGIYSGKGKRYRIEIKVEIHVYTQKE